MAENSPENFEKVVLNWVEDVKEISMLIIRESIITVNNEIVQTTPVLTGFLRASYFAKIGSDAPVGVAGAGTSAINAIAKRLQPGQVYTMGNVAAYARRVHDGFVGTDSLGRNYNQRGRFWISAVAARIPLIVEATIVRFGFKV